MIIRDGLPWLAYNDANAASAVVPSAVEWDSAEPQAIHVTFNRGREVPWVFARDLVHAALRDGEAGVGDVNIKIEGDTLLLTLDSPFGTRRLRTKAAYLEKFLARTCEIVPLDSEDYIPVVDAAIDEILGRRE
jgi:sporulation and cell division protein SsgA